MEIGQKYVPNVIHGGIVIKLPIISNKKLTSSAKLVYGILEHTKGEECIISYQDISKKLGVTEQCVEDAIQNLIVEDFISQLKIPQDESGKSLFQYLFHWNQYLEDYANGKS